MFNVHINFTFNTVETVLNSGTSWEFLEIESTEARAMFLAIEDHYASE